MAVPFHFEEVDEIDVIRQQLQAILTLLANRPRTMNQQQQQQHQPSHPSSSSHQARLLNVQPSSSSNTISASENLNRHRNDHENANNRPLNPTMNTTSSDQINRNININNTTVDGSTNTARPWRNFRDEITHLAQQLTDENTRQMDNANNDQTKISITTFFGNTQDWAHLGVTMRRIAEANTATAIIKTEHSTTTSAQSRSSNGLLSELIPDDWTTPLWTAMICFVGWHVFRSR